MAGPLSRRGLFRSLVGRQTEAQSDQGEIINKLIISNCCIEYKGVSCRRCGEVCDHGAIAFKVAGRGISHPVVDINQCTLCGECLNICPVSAITLTFPDTRGSVKDRTGSDGEDKS